MPTVSSRLHRPAAARPWLTCSLVALPVLTHTRRLHRVTQRLRAVRPAPPIMLRHCVGARSPRHASCSSLPPRLPPGRRPASNRWPPCIPQQGRHRPALVRPTQPPFPSHSPAAARHAGRRRCRSAQMPPFARSGPSLPRPRCPCRRRSPQTSLVFTTGPNGRNTSSGQFPVRSTRPGSRNRLGRGGLEKSLCSSSSSSSQNKFKAPPWPRARARRRLQPGPRHQSSCPRGAAW